MKEFGAPTADLGHKIDGFAKTFKIHSAPGNEEERRETGGASDI